MPLWELEEWLDEQDRPDDVLWYVKRLSANDTQANGSHQAGPYIPKRVLFNVFPSLERRNEINPRESVEMAVDSHHDTQRVTAIWYNNKTRNEVRITGHGGSDSALLDPESTAALTIFSFWRETETQLFRCHVWIARDVVEENVIEERVGSVESGRAITYPNLLSPLRRRASCRPAHEDIPPEWLKSFPTGEEIIQKVIEMRLEESANVDHRLMVRRNCEFEVYQSLEEAVYFPRIQKGFQSVAELLDFSQPIGQRRRARGGRSLELQLKTIFQEEEIEFAWQPVVDSNNHPDFLFPNVAAYEDPAFPGDQLRMLAAKSTIRERWRQVLKEANRIKTKHILTLQEGVSENQFSAMQEAGISLIVPEQLHDHYPKGVRPHLQTVESFLGDIRALRR